MSIHHFMHGDYSIDATPMQLPDGTFAARAVVTRGSDRHVEEIRPDLASFGTEAEAASAAHLAAVAWAAHQDGSA